MEGEHLLLFFIEKSDQLLFFFFFFGIMMPSSSNNLKTPNCLQYISPIFLEQSAFLWGFFVLFFCFAFFFKQSRTPKCGAKRLIIPWLSIIPPVDKPCWPLRLFSDKFANTLKIHFSPTSLWTAQMIYSSNQVNRDSRLFALVGSCLCSAGRYIPAAHL